MNRDATDAPKLFISYAHKDEEFMTALKTHLSPLERNGTIVSWVDREMIAGDKLDPEIQRNLETADMIALLISADFIQSVSCYEKEFRSALKREREDEIRIIPILVRDCVWEETELSEFLIVPQDANPIAESSDRDAAWAEVTRQIRENAKLLAETNLTVSKDTAPSTAAQVASDAHSKWLKESPLAFQHTAKNEIDLSDVFVFQDLKGSHPDNEDIMETISSSVFVDVRRIEEGTFIHGGDQSGKTSLIKTLCSTYLRAGHLPLVAKGNDISTSNLMRALGPRVKEQYSNLDWASFLAERNLRILLIDDLHTTRLNPKYLQQFIFNAKEHFQHVVLSADTSITFDEHKMVVLSAFHRWEILPFGHVRRGELIEKWNSLGKTETIENAVLHRRNDETTRSVNSLIRRNLLPPKPFYVLTILQMLDSVMPSNFELSSYGHCYQVLILQSLQKAGLRSQELDPYVNYLTELAFFIFKTKREKLTRSEFDDFKRAYSKEFILQSHDKVLRYLHAAEIIQSDEANLRFSYKYILYFYAAKYMSENLDEVAEDVQWLCERMHLESNANVLIFLMHHSRDQRVIDEVLLREQLIFDGTSPAMLSLDETNHIIGLVRSVRDLVSVQIDVTEERRKALERADEVDRNFEHVPDEDEWAEDDEMLADIVRSSRLVDVVGQILRNRSGSLRKAQLVDLVQAGFSSGLKFLSFWLNFTRGSRDALIAQIAAQMIEYHPDASKEKLERMSMKSYLGFCYEICLGVIKRTANCLGSSDLVEIYDDLQRGAPDSVAIQLINVAIHLEFKKRIPKSTISSLNATLDSNPIARLLLQEVVVQHLYLNEVEIGDKQWISSTLGIPIASQRRIASMKATKV